MRGGVWLLTGLPPSGAAARTFFSSLETYHAGVLFSNGHFAVYLINPPVCIQVKWLIQKKTMVIFVWFFKISNILLHFFKDWPTPVSFSFIFVFPYNFRCQQDSNSDRQSRRRGRWPLDHHHSPISLYFMVSKNETMCVFPFDTHAWYFLCY